MKFILSLLAAAVATASAQGTATLCTTNSCTSYCAAYDTVFSGCSNLYANTTALLICACTSGSGVSVDTGDLELCTACNQDGLGQLPLHIYQTQLVICYNYLEYGQAAAIEKGSEQETAGIAEFSSTYLPVIQSLCPAGALSASATATGAAATSAIGTVAYTNAATSIAQEASTFPTTAQPTSTFKATAITAVTSPTTNRAATTSTLPSGATVLTAASGGLPAGATLISNAAARWQVAEMAVLGLPVIGAML